VLAVEGANGGAMKPEDMASIGQEVDHLLKQLGVVGNSSLRGQRLFAGEQVDSDPFTLTVASPGYTYNGDTGTMRREYDVNAYLTINTPGEATFGPAMTALVNLRDHLNAGNTTDIGTTTLVGITFDAYGLLRMAAQVRSVHFYQATVLVVNHVAVVVKEHRALLCQWALRVEGVHDLACAGRVRSCTAG
jgi:flagellin-like hook-associated protein FlgL